MALGSASPRGELRRCHVFSNFGTSRGPTVDIFMLVVGAPGPSAPAPPGGPLSTFSRWWWALPELQLWHLPGGHRRRFHVGGGRSRTFSSDTSRGPTVDIFTLMVRAPGSSAPAPPVGPLSMFSRWWWALLDLQLQHLPGARCRRFHVDRRRKDQDNRVGHRKISPTCGFTASPEVGPGASVDIVKIGYPPHTSSKSRQGAGCASMPCHVSCSFGPHIPAEVEFGATMCSTAPDLTSLLR
jgi:hypothetical protein